MTARTVVGQNFALELGDVSESITVTFEGAQVETQAARINDTISEDVLRSMPLQGRMAVSVVLTSPGITGKFESFGGTYCCDVFGVLKSPDFSSGGNEFKTNYTVDGLSMRFTDGPQWGMSFQPNPDAIEEVNVSVSPNSAEQGSVSGPQVQMITKGGTNLLHGTGHYTFQQDNLNAVPFRSTRDAVPDAHYKLFGGRWAARSFTTGCSGFSRTKAAKRSARTARSNWPRPKLSKTGWSARARIPSPRNCCKTTSLCAIPRRDSRISTATAPLTSARWWSIHRSSKVGSSSTDESITTSRAAATASTAATGTRARTKPARRCGPTSRPIS